MFQECGREALIFLNNRVLVVLRPPQAGPSSPLFNAFLLFLEFEWFGVAAALRSWGAAGRWCTVCWWTGRSPPRRNPPGCPGSSAGWATGTGPRRRRRGRGARRIRRRRGQQRSRRRRWWRCADARRKTSRTRPRLLPRARPRSAPPPGPGCRRSSWWWRAAGNGDVRRPRRSQIPRAAVGGRGGSNGLLPPVWAVHCPRCH